MILSARLRTFVAFWPSLKLFHRLDKQKILISWFLFFALAFVAAVERERRCCLLERSWLRLNASKPPVQKAALSIWIAKPASTGSESKTLRSFLFLFSIYRGFTKLKKCFKLSARIVAGRRKTRNLLRVIESNHEIYTRKKEGKENDKPKFYSRLYQQI